MVRGANPPETCLFEFGGAEGDTNADFYYYHWVDQHDTLGLGAKSLSR